MSQKWDIGTGALSHPKEQKWDKKWDMVGRGDRYLVPKMGHRDSQWDKVPVPASQEVEECDMGKILVITEKPSVGRDIAKVLKCTGKGDGCLFNDQYVVSWAIGHLVALKDPEEYDVVYKNWRMDTLPIIPAEMRLKTLPKTNKQFQILKKWINSKEVDSLICATDSGREGELIFRYIYQLAGSKKPFQRLWISSMTDEAIRKGFERLKPGVDYDGLYFSARCRSEADWLVGINASRAFTIMYRVLLSVGRVQTPTLAILVARQKEIDEFVSRDYWEVTSDYGSFKAIWYRQNVNETKIATEEEANKIADKVRGKTGTIQEVRKEDKTQPFPQLYDLTELQRDANKRYGFSAQKTLTTAQHLYENKKLITYPRTDSRYLSTDIVPELTTTLQKINCPPYAEYIEKILALPNLPAGKRLVDNSKITDHHAIIPTKTTPNLRLLSDDEQKIYDLIVKRFIAVFYPPYAYEQTQVHICTEEETFYAKGTVIKSLGWKEVYAQESAKEQDQEQEPTLPQVCKGDKLLTEDIQVTKKKTSPPKSYTEASLLSAMENAGRFVEDEALKEQLKEGGLGTPATRAATIERLIYVGYVVRKGKALVPTSKGINLITIVPEELKSPETTGKWERALTQIAKGTMPPDKFMGSITRYVHYIVQESNKRKQGIVFEKEAKGKRNS